MLCLEQFMRILIVLRRVLVRAFSMAVVRVLSDEKHWLCLLYPAMLSRRYRHHGACKRSSIEICHFAPCETNLQHHDFMYVYIYIYVQVEPAQGGWRKFPGLRSVTLWDPKTRFAYRRCSGPSQLLSSVL